MPDPASYFGITPPGSPLSQFFPQPEDDFRAQLEERPKNRSAIPPEYAIASQMPDPQGFLKQVDDFRTQKESQDIIKGLQGLDFGSKDYPSSVAKLLSKNSRGASNSAVQNILKMKEFSGRQNQDSKYNAQAAGAVKDFLAIPEDDPDYDQKYQKFVQGLDADVLEHPRLASLLERGQHNSSVVRSKKTAQQQERLAVEKEARRAGIQPSKYDNLDDLNDAIADRMHEAGQQKELRDFLRTDKDTAKDLSSALTQLRAPTSGADWDAEKAQVMGKEINQMTPDDWHQAHPLALQARIAKARNIANQIEMMTGVNPMKGGATTQEAAPQAKAAPSAPAKIPTFNSPAEVEGAGLPKGTVVMVGGKRYRID